MNKPVAATPQHFRHIVFRPVSGLMGCACRLLKLQASTHRLPKLALSG